MREHPLDRGWLRTAAGVAGLVAALALWQAVAGSGRVLFLVPVSIAAARLWLLVTGPRLLTDVLPSIARALLGLAVGSAAGILVGMSLGYFRRVDPWIRPPMEFMRATPIPAILPVVILTFGPSDGSRVFVIALGSLWPVLLNAIDGARSVDPLYLDTARVMGLGGSRILWRVIWPAALPRIFTGLRVGLGISLVMMVVSEMMASEAGLGYFVLQAQRSYALADMYGGVIALGLLGGVLTLVFSVVERRVLRWYAGQRGLGHV